MAGDDGAAPASEPVAAGIPASASPWAPFAHRLFATLWLAQFVSNVGTWMQNVGAAWLMGSLGGSAFEVALVQSATALPVFLVGVPAGALADIVAPRRLLLVTQVLMVTAASGLAFLTEAGLTTPLLLLAFTFALGLGMAINLPAWQAIQPELVPAAQFPEAVALGGVNINGARVIGPALGGLVVAASGPTAVFAINAGSFLAVLAVLSRWRRPVREPALPRETLAGAIQAGFRYGLHSPALRSVLVRALALCLPGSAVLALLPVLARGRLGLGAGGYGVLLACFGLGAVVSAVVLPRLRARWAPETVVAAAEAVLASVLLVLAWAPRPEPLAPALVLGGAAWLAALAAFNVAAQGSVPEWVRARGMGLYLLVFQGSTALGSALWGAVAEVDVAVAFVAAAVLLAAGLAATARLPLGRYRTLDLRPSPTWPEPVVTLPPAPGQGPVLVTLEYRVPPERVDAFVARMRVMERLRRRTGARRWNLFRDPAHPDRFLETFVVASWEEHLRQHRRYTATDQVLQDEAIAVAGGGPVRVDHYVSVY